MNPCMIVLGPLPTSFEKPSDTRIISMMEGHEVTPQIVEASDELYVFAWDEAHVRQMVSEVSKHLDVVNICTFDQRYQALVESLHDTYLNHKDRAGA